MITTLVLFVKLILMMSGPHISLLIILLSGGLTKQQTPAWSLFFRPIFLFLGILPKHINLSITILPQPTLALFLKVWFQLLCSNPDLTYVASRSVWGCMKHTVGSKLQTLSNQIEKQGCGKVGFSFQTDKVSSMKEVVNASHNCIGLELFTKVATGKHQVNVLLQIRAKQTANPFRNIE